MAGLARAVDAPGTTWLVDLPGDGSNRGGPQVPARPYERWPTVLAEAHPVAGPAEAADAFGQDPNDETLRLLTLAAAEWNFTPEGLAAGHALLDGLPYCHEAVAWADAHFDATYRALWKPHSGLPTLILSGAEDHVVDQRLWADDPAFGRPHVLRRTIEGAARSARRSQS
ncbi:hypothetical protein AB0D40_34075 [Streptomyces massasporeus]|uniref:hypothetical protein n=1 Tax=Streptomyces massasporeus TaxID=67324 RepID=UPI0033C5635D